MSRNNLPNFFNYEGLEKEQKVLISCLKSLIFTYQKIHVEEEQIARFRVVMISAR